MRVFFVFDCFAAGVDPEDGDHAVLVGCVDELGGFGEHVGFVFAAEVDGVADSGDFDAAVGEVGDLVNGPELGADGVFLGDADKVGFGVHFDEVGYLGVVHGVAGDEAELGGKDADLGFGCDAEEVFRVAVVGGDACAAEVVVEVFDLLVTGKQHEAAGSAGDHGVVFDIAFLHILGNVKRYLHISHGVLVGGGEG